MIDRYSSEACCDMIPFASDDLKIMNLELLKFLLRSPILNGDSNVVVYKHTSTRSHFLMEPAPYPHQAVNAKLFIGRTPVWRYWDQHGSSGAAGVSHVITSRPPRTPECPDRQQQRQPHKQQQQSQHYQQQSQQKVGQ